MNPAQDKKIYFLFLILSFLFLVSSIGLENILVTKTEWLHHGNDSSLPHMGWFFFKNDIWRFPLGSNPNYGMELGSSIVFSDSIPILALIFKLFRFFLPENFQYISIWYFICFYFQLYFSYKILNEFTKSYLYSFISSIFFLVTPILIWKFQIVPALTGQWVLLFALYIGLTRRVDETTYQWLFLIILSSLINFYFLVIIAASYSLLRLINLNFKKEYIFKLLKDFIFIFLILVFTMYVAGYFEIRLVDTLSLGFGRDKLNLLGIFDSTNNINNISFSWILPDLKLSYGEETEGFNFFGLGQIILVFFAFFIFIRNKYSSSLNLVKINREIKSFFIISIFFTFWALSNKISIGSFTILEIPLNKYVYGLLSTVRPTGRLFWIVNYFLLIWSLIIIFQCFNEKKSIIIISFLLLIQIADTSAGLKDRMFFAYNKNKLLKDNIWGELFSKYKIIKSTFPENYSSAFATISYTIEKYNLEKTNIIKLAKINRKEVAEAKYNLYKDFTNKILSEDTVYLIDKLGQLKHLKHLFKDEDVGFFYRDNLWLMVLNEKNLMNSNDKNELNKLKLNVLKIDKKENLNFKNKDSYYGLGWSHNFGKSGIWSEGQISTLLFRVQNNDNDLQLELNCKPYLNTKNKSVEFDIYINNKFKKKVKLANANDEILKFIINKNFIKDNEIVVDFIFKNLVSPFEVLESPDARKLGILLRDIKINQI